MDDQSKIMELGAKIKRLEEKLNSSIPSLKTKTKE